MIHFGGLGRVGRVKHLSKCNVNIALTPLISVLNDDRAILSSHPLCQTN